MAPPRKRLVIKKNRVHTEFIPRTIEKKTILGDATKKNRVLKFLSRKAKRKQVSNRLKLLRQRKPFTRRPTNSTFRFRRIETLVKNKHTSMKHWSQTALRGNSKRYLSHVQRRISIENAPILFIVRIHGKKNIPFQISSMLHSLRLSQAFYGIIVRNTPLLQHYLPYLDNYITYGVPTSELIRDLILKRGKILADSIGYGKSGRHSSRSVIRSNVIVEKILGKHDIICIEDIIHILSSNPYQIGTQLERMKLKKLTKKLLKNTIFERSTLNNNNIEKSEEMKALELANMNRLKLQSIMKDNLSQTNKNESEKKSDEKIIENNEIDLTNSNESNNETIFDLIEKSKQNQIIRYDLVCDYINPFELNGMKIPMKGLTGAFDHKGYYGYRGEHINKYIEKLI